MRVFFMALMLLSETAMASDTLIASLERRLRTDGPEKVNAYLAAHPPWIAEMSQRTSDCEPEAVALAVKLSRTTDLKAADLHRQSLRVAAGACGEYVLTLLSVKEVPQVCASVTSWTVSQTARELRRRIKEIEGNDKLRSTERGRVCSAAYRYELENTRVGLRIGPPGPPGKGK